MILTIKSKIAECEKGCGKTELINGKEHPTIREVGYTCGNDYIKFGIHYCPSCQAKISTWKEALKLFEEAEFKIIRVDENKFEGYMCEEGEGIIISHIKSKDKGKGNFSRLVKELKRKYNFIKIPTPSNEMKAIAEHLGFELLPYYFPKPFNCIGEIMLWYSKEPFGGQT